jgi:hypothetical protein
MAERTREALQAQPGCGVGGVGFGDGSSEQVKLLDDETERDGRDPCPNPGQEGSFVRRVVRVSSIIETSFTWESGPCVQPRTAAHDSGMGFRCKGAKREMVDALTL